MSWLPVATLLLSLASAQPAPAQAAPVQSAHQPALAPSGTSRPAPVQSAAAQPPSAGPAAVQAQPAPSAQPVTAVTAAPLNVMTFNIRYGTAQDGDNHWLKRRDQLFALLRDLQPDVIGLQEALHGQIEEIQAAVPGYAYVGVGRSDGHRAGEYAAILFKQARLQVRRSDTFWFSDTPQVVASKTWGNQIERICTWAYFEDAQGPPFYVYNVHLDHQSQPSRERSVSLLLDRIAARAPAAPVIVTGDFNAGEQNRAVLLMRGKLRDTFRERHPDAAEVGTFSNFAYGNTRGDKIDFVFASPDVEVLDAEIVRASRDQRYPSDHFPVTARVRVK